MKTISILILSLVFCSGLYAQEQKIYLGVDGSSTIRWLYGEDLGFDKMAAFGYSAGLTFQYKLKKRFSIISGPGYEKKGDISESSVRDLDGLLIGATKYRSTYNYLTMPVLASLSNTKGNLYVASGPYLGYLISRIDKIDAVSNFPGINENVTEYSKRLDFGWTLEFGYKFRLGNRMNMDLGIRDNLGLLNTTKGDLKIKNNTLGLRIGFSYGL